MGLPLAQLMGNEGVPRFEPVMSATMPGAIGPATRDAALITELLVIVGVCACAARAKREHEIVMPISDVRNGYSIRTKLCRNILSVYRTLWPL
jgi:hypothetical protein